MPRIPARCKVASKSIGSVVPTVFRFSDDNSAESSGFDDGLRDDHHGSGLLRFVSAPGAKRIKNFIGGILTH